uniref:Uncharacterized protein n=1 Tax=viral metagenome TaxID=1070528 RepID=A0A6M3LGB7_9ZZZZ
MSLKEATEYLIRTYPHENFLLRDSCPKCGVNWKSIQEDVEIESLGSESLAQALCIISNCDLCKIKFSRLLRNKGLEV